jgi:putative PIN family toxin of toxin-antitoxin system
VTDLIWRFVFDTNVLISAFLNPRAVPGQALLRAQRTGIVLASDETLAELEGVLSRPKFDGRISVSARKTAFDGYVGSVLRTEPTEIVAACFDPKDDKFLTLAVNGRADFILSGDNHLLVMHPFRGIDILTPGDYLARQPR